MKNLQQDHKTRKATIEIEVDLNLADFIDWMNTLPGVKTHSCCEGTYIDEIKGPDYHMKGVSTQGFIIFTCENETSLIAIHQAICSAHANMFEGWRLDIALEFTWDYSYLDARIIHSVLWSPKRCGTDDLKEFLKNLKNGIPNHQIPPPGYIGGDLVVTKEPTNMVYVDGGGTSHELEELPSCPPIKTGDIVYTGNKAFKVISPSYWRCYNCVGGGFKGCEWNGFTPPTNCMRNPLIEGNKPNWRPEIKSNE